MTPHPGPAIEEPRRPRGLLVVFFGHAMLVQIITFVLRPSTTYRALELDVPTAWLGVLGASFAFVPLLLAVSSGQAVDRFGERRVMIIGAVLVCVAALGFVTLAETVTGLVAASIVLGIGHLLSVVGQQAMVANSVPRQGYDTAFGRYTFATSLGQAIGPGLIIMFGGDRPIPDTSAIFVGAGALTFVLLLLSWWLPRGTRSTTTVEKAGGTVGALVRTPGLFRALTISALVLAAMEITLIYLPALGTERDIAAQTIGVLLGLRAVAAMASRLFLGRLTNMFGRRNLLVASVALAAASLVVLSLPMPVWMLGLVMAVLGLGLGAGQPLTMSWLAESTPAGLRGRAMSLRLTGNRLGQVLLPSLAGAVAAGAGAAGVLALTGFGLGVVAVAARRLQAANGPPRSQ